MIRAGFYTMDMKTVDGEGNGVGEGESCIMQGYVNPANLPGSGDTVDVAIVAQHKTGTHPVTYRVRLGGTVLNFSIPTSPDGDVAATLTSTDGQATYSLRATIPRFVDPTLVKVTAQSPDGAVNVWVCAFHFLPTPASSSPGIAIAHQGFSANGGSISSLAYRNDDGGGDAQILTAQRGHLLLLTVWHRQGTILNITGGLTWSLVKTVNDGAGPSANYVMSVYRAMVATATTYSITVNFDSGVTLPNAVMVALDDITGVDDSGVGGSGAIVQAASIDAASGINTTVGLSTFGSLNNATWTALEFVHSSNDTTVPPSGFTLLHSYDVGSVVGRTAWRKAAITSVLWSWATSESNRAIAIELRSK